MARTHGRGGAGIRKSNKKGSTKGSGGQRRKGLVGKGPTPKAEDRVNQAQPKAKLGGERRNSGRHQKETAEMVVGRNPVSECLHAKGPDTSLYIVQGTRSDARLSEAV
ncbi:23S rRNA (guanosine(2251)-2'-O)-methyltransferase RlmB, partial [Staphylococcus epidermidis]